MSEPPAVVLHTVPRRPRIRSRRSSSSPPEEEETTLANEERRWIDLDFEKIVSEEEVEAVRRSVWKARGYGAEYFDNLRTWMDYRQAWELGDTGMTTRVSRGRTSEQVFVRVDGTDTNTFMRIHFLSDESVMVRGADALYTATFDRSAGTVTMPDMLLGPFISKGFCFLDAMVFLLWEMKTQLKLNDMRLDYYREQRDRQAADEDERRQRSRRRAQLKETVFDQRPEYNKISQALAFTPSVKRP